MGGWKHTEQACVCQVRTKPFGFSGTYFKGEVYRIAAFRAVSTENSMLLHGSSRTACCLNWCSVSCWLCFFLLWMKQDCKLLPAVQLCPEAEVAVNQGRGGGGGRPEICKQRAWERSQRSMTCGRLKAKYPHPNKMCVLKGISRVGFLFLFYLFFLYIV